MSMAELKADLINRAGRLPLVGGLLRRWANRFPEGSCTTIETGLAAGMRWVRHHRYVNGYWLGNYEFPVQKALSRMLRPGDVFYDVGANAGFFSLLAARVVGPTGRVYAFDPLPENLESIREQFEANGLSNGHGIAAAVGDREGEVAFSDGGGCSAEARVGSTGRPGERTIRVPMTTLDRFTEAHPKPALVKVDVEGAESAVVRGAPRLIREGTLFLFEFHGENNARDAVEMLTSLGYVFLDLRGDEVRGAESAPHVIAHPAGWSRDFEGIIER